MSTDDPALISRAQRGDVSAFEALVQPHQQSLLRLILATNRNPDDAQDCLQEALISAYRAIPRFRCESGFRTWLCRIALNVTRNWIRAEARASAQRFRQDPLRILSPASTNIDENLLREDDANTIRRALAALPAHYRDVLLLRYYSDLPYDEIARALELPVGTVRSRLSEGRRLLLQRLTALGYIPTAKEAQPR